VPRYRYRIGARMRTILRYFPDDGGPLPRSLLVRMLQDDYLISRQAAHQALARALRQGLVAMEGDEVALARRVRRTGAGG